MSEQVEPFIQALRAYCHSVGRMLSLQPKAVKASIRNTLAQYGSVSRQQQQKARESAEQLHRAWMEVKETKRAVEAADMQPIFAIAGREPAKWYYGVLYDVNNLTETVHDIYVATPRQEMTREQYWQCEKLIERLYMRRCELEHWSLIASAVKAAQAPARPAKPEADEASDAGGPTQDPHDHRVAWWAGKRIYLGNDTQVSRLFWLLAKPVGRAAKLYEVQRAIDGMETTRDMRPDDVRKAAQRLRKAISELRAALRDAGMDHHVCVVRGGTQAEPEYSMVWRFGK